MKAMLLISACLVAVALFSATTAQPPVVKYLFGSIIKEYKKNKSNINRPAMFMIAIHKLSIVQYSNFFHKFLNPTDI